jgi:hypothetical protein
MRPFNADRRPAEAKQVADYSFAPLAGPALFIHTAVLSSGGVGVLMSTVARKALAVIRILNGTAGLLAPEKLLTRLGVDTSTDRSGTYPFRMFGIRTILIGLDLLVLSGDELRRAEKLAVLIHATDTVSAAVTAARGDLPRKQGLVAIVISAINTALAVTAWKGGRDAIPADNVVHQSH